MLSQQSWCRNVSVSVFKLSMNLKCNEGQLDIAMPLCELSKKHPPACHVTRRMRMLTAALERAHCADVGATDEVKPVLEGLRMNQDALIQYRKPIFKYACPRTIYCTGTREFPAVQIRSPTRDNASLATITLE